MECRLLIKTTELGHEGGKGKFVKAHQPCESKRGNGRLRMRPARLRSIRHRMAGQESFAHHLKLFGLEIT